MKRFAALLTACILLLGASALAFNGEGYPAWDGAAAPDNALFGAFGEERIALSFDSSDDYSNLEDGIVQACFFAYDKANENFLEMYLLIPQDVQAGDVLTSSQGLDCSIYLYETAVGSETFYYAGDLGNGSTAGSSFELTIESAETTGTTLAMRGRLHAELAHYDSDASGRKESLTISEALFSFQLPLNENPFLPAPSQEPDAIEPNQPSATFPSLPDAPRAGGGTPSFTLPPNYISL